MDTAQIDTALTFLAVLAQTLKTTGVRAFLLFAGYCTAMHAAALLFIVLAPLIRFARGCTVHMLKALRGVVDELLAGPASIRGAFHSDSVADSTTGPADDTAPNTAVRQSSDPALDARLHS